jgi:hypothetical protein
MKTAIVVVVFLVLVVFVVVVLLLLVLVLVLVVSKVIDVFGAKTVFLNRTFCSYFFILKY